mmetsp:Transcript_34224/g.73095  ORF Transcript_34224/g.73095 Transcript_34224/m.73095 type:complete len:284 (-) Transcript_34224:3-854(-)
MAEVSFLTWKTRAQLNESGWALVRGQDLRSADALMSGLSQLLHVADGWPTYTAAGADSHRRPLSRYFHSVTQRNEPTVALAPHNELSYTECAPIGVVAFLSLSSNFSGGHTVLSANAQESLPPGTTYRYTFGGRNSMVPVDMPSMFTRESYLQLGSVETFFSARYVEHLLRMFKSLLPYAWRESLSATMRQFGGGEGHHLLSAHDMLRADAAYFGAVTHERSRTLQLLEGELLVLDNRRYTHAVLPSTGRRLVGVAMLDDAAGRRHCAAEIGHAAPATVMVTK